MAPGVGSRAALPHRPKERFKRAAEDFGGSDSLAPGVAPQSLGHVRRHSKSTEQDHGAWYFANGPERLAPFALNIVRATEFTRVDSAFALFKPARHHLP